MEDIFKQTNYPARKGSLVLAIFLIAVSAYLDSLLNGFVHDDLFQVIRNPWIKDFSNIPAIFRAGVWGFNTNPSNYYRPMMHLGYMLDYYLFGLAPWGFHLMNLAFHAANCVLVFIITEKLLQDNLEKGSLTSVAAPLITAVVFAVHPIHTESVAWVAGLPDLSYTFFYLLSFYFYLISRNKEGSTNKWFIFLSATLFFISMLCKEPAITLPVILIGYDYIKKRFGPRPVKYLINYLPYCFAVFIYLCLRFWALGGFKHNRPYYNLTVYQNIVNFFPLFANYIKRLLLPYNLNAFYTFHPVMGGIDASLALSVFMAAGFFAILAVSLWRRSIISIGLLLIVVPLLPSIYIPALGKVVFAERYLYLSVFGFGLLFSLLVKRISESAPGWSKPLAVSLVMLAMLYSAETFTRNKVWKDNLTLWSDIAEKSADSADAHNNLGAVYMEEGKLDDAENHFARSIEIEPLNLEAHGNLGIIHRKKGESVMAIKEFMLALDIDPDNEVAHYNLGVIYGNMYRYDEAVKEFTKVTEIAPLYADAHSNLGVIYAKTGQADKAVNELQLAIRLNPDDADSREYLRMVSYVKSN